MQKSDRVLLMTWSSIPRNCNNRAHISNDENYTQFKYKMNINRVFFSLSNVFPVLLSFLGPIVFKLTSEYFAQPYFLQNYA